MGNTINMGGGSIATGTGAIAVGANGNAVINSPGASQMITAHTIVLAGANLSAFLGDVGALKAALIAPGIEDGAGLALQLGELEREALAQAGQVNQASARKLMGRIRYAGRGAKQVADAVARAAKPFRAKAEPCEVFVSYKQQDRARVMPLVAALQALAIDVWFDAYLQPGQDFTGEICEEIDGCRAQLVCWSNAAVISPWVQGEAEFGRQRDVLVPVFLESCRPQPPFNMIHTEDLSDWRPGAEHSKWSKVVTTIGAKLGRPDLEQLSGALARSDAGGVRGWVDAHPQDAFSRMVTA